MQSHINNQKFFKNRKSLAIAYLLLLLCGPCGFHNFYAGRKYLARIEFFLLITSVVCFYFSYSFGASFLRITFLFKAVSNFSGVSTAIVDNVKILTFIALYAASGMFLLLTLLIFDFFALPSLIRRINNKKELAVDKTNELVETNKIDFENMRPLDNTNNLNLDKDVMQGVYNQAPTLVK